MATEVTKICGYCGELFTTTRAWQKYCIPDHQKQIWLDANRLAAEAIRSGKVTQPATINS